MNNMDMDSRKPVRNLTESIHSLLGFKAHLTSAWVSSVCSIIRNLPSEAAPAADLVAHKNFEELSSLKNAVDSNKDVTGIKDELVQLVSLQNQLDAQRRQLLTEILDLKGNIRVFCRIRPALVWHELNQPSHVIPLNSNDLILQLSASKSKHYRFDKVFKPDSSQDEVFSDIEPVIKSVVDGYNACIFAYGQTGSGKTYTMEGTPECPGVVHRGIEALFKQATVSSQELTVTFSMLEIYLGNLKDLLVPHSSRVTHFAPPCLSVQTDPKGGIKIDNLTSVQVSSSEQALALYSLGCQLRATATTNLNKTSSRSHCMIRIKIKSHIGLERRRERSKLWMIDLGGSERVLKTKAHGRRFEEGKAINLSLSALGDVIDALQRKRCHIPYRNSKLTLVLQDCLGDDSKTIMLVHVNPEKEALCESACSLNFATRARSIHLNSRDSQDTKEHKKVALLILQQKIDKIEDERQGVKRKIEQINKAFESLANASNLPSSQFSGGPQLFTAASTDIVCIDKIKNMQKFPSLELPRFMQPTVCSTRKSGAEQKFYEDKSMNPARRRSISQRPNSVSFPLKRNGVCSSDLSTSSVVDLNMISTVDVVTECSQNPSECDTQTTDFHMQGSISKVTSHQTAHHNHIPIVPDNFRRRKWESKWQIQEQNVGVREQKQRGGLPLSGHNTLSLELPVNRNEPDTVDEGQLNIMPRLETAKSFTINRCDVLCHRTSSEPWTQHQYLKKGLPKVDVDYFSESYAQVWNERTPTSDLVDQKDSMQSICNGIKNSKNHTMDQSIHTPDSWNEEYADYRKSFGESLLMQDTGVQLPKPCCLDSAKKSILESISASIQGLSKEKTQYVNGLQSRRALFTEKLKQDKVHENVNTHIVQSQVIPQGTGLIISIKTKIQMLYFCALIWLGFWNLGYDEDFFHSLTH